jgi:starch phosphorylase
MSHLAGTIFASCSPVIPSWYGIRYEFGIFEQVIREGWQCEMTDKWLKNGNPWDIARSEIAYDVKFGGHTEAWADDQGRFRVRWIPQTGDTRRCLRHADCRLPRWYLQHAAPLESRGRRVVRLRCVQPRRLRPRGRGQSRVGDDHQSALPETKRTRGKVLRLKQQFFFTSCSLQDMLRIQALIGGHSRQFA